ncbi:MAG: adenosylcobinamide-GDP ribazoletransferase [Deltaproteobacteria bacterium]|nr:adenosylcobinamide-GDP ribazoletransferase [Deltaproteobacteria bacterium]
MNGAFRSALQFLTRLPTPGISDEQATQLGRAVPHFPLVGAIVGALSAAIAYGATAAGLSPGLAAIAAVASAALVTGALHEDGLADSADGLFAGSRDRALEIMRDSRTGVFGATALILAFALRFGALWSTDPAWWLRGLVAAHALGRWAAAALLITQPYARSGDETARATAFTRSRPKNAFWPTSIVALALAFLAGGRVGLVAILLAVCVVGGWAALTKRRIGGQTGDTMGAACVMAEIGTLLVFAATHPASSSPWGIS